MVFVYVYIKFIITCFSTWCILKARITDVRDILCKDKVWFGLVGFSLNASLEPQLSLNQGLEGGPALRKTLLLATLFGLGGISRELRSRLPIPGPHVRLNAGWSLADDIAVL